MESHTPTPTAVLYGDPRDNATRLIALTMTRARARLITDALATSERFADRHQAGFAAMELQAGMVHHVREIRDSSPLRTGKSQSHLEAILDGRHSPWVVHEAAVRDGLDGRRWAEGKLRITSGGMSFHVQGARAPVHNTNSELSLGILTAERLATALLPALDAEDLNAFWPWFVRETPETLLDMASGPYPMVGGTVPQRRIPAEAVAALLEHPSKGVRERAIRDLAAFLSGPAPRSTPTHAR